MTLEDELAMLEARLRSIPHWLEVVYIMSEIRKIKALIDERFLEHNVEL